MSRTHLVSFRPGVAAQGTALEAMAHVYEYLQETHDYRVTVVQAEDDTFHREALDFRTVSGRYWSLAERAWDLGLPVPLDHRIVPGGGGVRSLFDRADGVLTVDPTTRPQGQFAVRQAGTVGTPVWFDAGRTVSEDRGQVRWKLQRRRLAALLADVTGIIATSPKVLERFREIGLFDATLAGKFTVMGHPTDTEQFAPIDTGDGDTIRILALARMVPEKGHYYVLEALDPLLRERDDVALELLGAGPMRSLLEREVERRGLEQQVRFRGKVPHDRVPRVLNEADLFVNHAVDIRTWEEFFGAANVEAMACGLPCVLTDSGSIPYVIRESDVAAVVGQRDVSEIREAVRTLLNDEEARQEMGQRARAFVKRENAVEVIGERYHEMLQSEL
jgi:glycosyltransferase involved in cell wall biosynthesis